MKDTTTKFGDAHRLAVRLALFCLALTLFVSQLVKSYNNLKEQKVGTETKLVGNLLVDPPALTICKNLHVKYNEDRLKEYQLINGLEGTLKGYDRVSKQNLSMREVLDYAEYSAKELVNYVVATDVTDYVEWGYGGVNQLEFSPSLDEEDRNPYAHWHPVHSPINGRCQQLVIEKEALAKFRSPMAILRFIFLEDIYWEGVPNWLIFLHAPYHFGSSEEVIPLPRGQLMEFQVNPVTIERVSTDEAPCIDVKEDKKFNRESCLIECVERTYLEQHGCQHPSIKRSTISGGHPDCGYNHYKNLYPNLAMDEGMYELDRIGVLLKNSTFVSETCGCPMSCLGKTVTTSVNHQEQFGEKLDGNSMLVLKFPSNVEVFREFLTYGWSDFISDCGAFFGVFLGASVYGMHDLVSDLIDWIADKNRNRKNKRRKNAVILQDTNGFSK